MSISTQHVRLAASVMVCAISAGFVMVYNRMSFMRFHSEHPDQTLTPFNDCMIRYGILGWLLPVLVITVGLIASQRAGREVWIEAVTQFGWILAIVWLLLSLLSWQIQSVPSLGPLGSN